MFIKLDAERHVQFEDRDNFRAFKVVLDANRESIETIRAALGGIAKLDDAETAWVSMGALRNWPDVAHDMQWQQSFTAMIEKARPHGWIDEQHQTIKAHVEWLA